MNFCRQMAKQFMEDLGRDLSPDIRAILRYFIMLASQSQKFMLPDGGRLYDDPEYKALDDSETLSLPFPIIAVEFERSPEFIGDRHPENYQPHKSLFFARQQEDSIAIALTVWNGKRWLPVPEVALPRVNYLDRINKSDDGYVGIKIAMSKAAERYGLPLSDYADEVGALLSMLNILSCSNVHVDRIEPKKAHAAMRKALPFDTYHVLKIDVPESQQQAGFPNHHRSPREHLRRGHIRRLDGRRIWVNATVVAHGCGGKIVKDYSLRKEVK